MVQIIKTIKKMGLKDSIELKFLANYLFDREGLNHLLRMLTIQKSKT